MGSRIFAAAILGDVDAVASQLREGDADLLLSKGNLKRATVMHEAAMHGHTDLVMWLANNYPRAQYVMERELLGRTPLHLAALNGKTNVVVELLKLPGIDPMCMDYKMHTPLLLAALNGHISVIIELLKGPIHQQLEQLTAANKHGHSALHLAVRCGHVSTVRFLLKRFEAIQALDRLTCKDRWGWTAMHSAAGMGRADIIEEIFKMCWNSVILSQVNNTVWSPLHVAAWLGHAEIVNLMCGKMGFCVNTTTQNLERLTPLHMAANNGHDVVVDDLLSHNELQLDNSDALRRTALHYAARQGHTSVVSKLLHSFKSKSTNSVNATDVNGLTALHLAAREGHEEVVRILLEKGANVNAKTESSLISKSLLDGVLSSNSTHETVIDPMILEGDCWCISQMTPLHLAARNGHMAVVQQLLKCPEVNIRALDGHGLMPQDWAEVREIKKEFLVCLEQASKSAGEISARVPKKKMQVLREEMMKWEKLVAAVMPPSTFHSFQSMQYMTEAWEDLDKCGREDGKVSGSKASGNLENEYTRGIDLLSTPCAGDLDTMERLKQEIYEITGQEEQSGNTPLHVAAKRGHKKAVEVLLHRGPMDDANAKNSEGHTALALAFEGNHVEICKLILQNIEEVEDDLHEMLETAMTNNWLDMVALLVGDARTHTGGGLSARLLDEASHSAEKSLLDVLLRRTTIKERLLQERKEHLDSAGAMLVIAAFIASITYQGVLQPPQGKHHRALLFFDWLNAIAFYSAVATTLTVASGSLPIRHMYELINARDPMRMSRGISCVLLIMSSACVVWAYATAGFSRAWDKMPFTFGNGFGATATTLFLFWFLKHYIQLYKPFCCNSHSRSDEQHNEGYIRTLCRTVVEVVQKLSSMFYRQEKGGLQDNLLQGNAKRCSVAV